MTDAAHAALMNATYRHQRRIYDLTRKYFLFGRDRLIARLDPPAGGSVLEVACGTGRNLDLIGRRYPGRALYGLDISSEMLESARARLGDRARLAEADAAAFDAAALWGVAAFDRIVLSYSLSMIPDWEGALARAADHLAPGGALHVVDFGDHARWPGVARRGLRGFLGKFHVAPRLDLAERMAALAAARGARLEVEALMGGYARRAVLVAA